MNAARVRMQRPSGAKLCVVDGHGRVEHWARSAFVELLGRGDLVIANDAATLPGSLVGRHLPSGRRIEARLAGSTSLAVDRVTSFTAVLFGLGDFRMRTEDRPWPPAVRPGDRLALGSLHASVARLVGNHPRLVVLEFDGTPGGIWEALARSGRPIQYAHLPSPLELSDTWTSIAGPPVAFEPPSAGFMVDWNALAGITSRGVRFATITHAAGISSTGDPLLDGVLPFDEPYRVPASTAAAIADARDRGGRIVAVGTTVVRALEHAAAADGIVRSGTGLATNRLGAHSQLRVVDAVFSGVHEPGTSHYELLRAFVDDPTLARIHGELNAHDYRTHEFGDSMFLQRLTGGVRLDEWRQMSSNGGRARAQPADGSDESSRLLATKRLASAAIVATSSAGSIGLARWI
jgi:S-adenosylmethionine:tRNA ribosyltransferase-isomerase